VTIEAKLIIIKIEQQDLAIHIDHKVGTATMKFLILSRYSLVPVPSLLNFAKMLGVTILHFSEDLNLFQFAPLNYM